MDSRTLLDYALFQLTPTRTRCDLVIIAGKKSEKIASGLLEPFLSHLKSAKDQISKGGYSITLKPTSSDASSWFTKATLERFVRFVSTPEVLERFVTTEREINQIERSIESNEQANGIIEVQGREERKSDLKKHLHFHNCNRRFGDYEAESEENPKVRLQRVLESRRAMLKKEQAMAYARALVVGFEMDYIYDLVSFSDAFGAFRLREACINFMELCKKKNDDKIWMDEVAAMQASYLGTSGIILAGENNDLYQTGPAKSSASDSITRHGSLDTSEGTDNGLQGEFNLQQTEGTAQFPTWPNRLPQYMQNPQGPMFQHIPPYPGYIFPGMQVPPSHYPGNVPWHTNFPKPSNKKKENTNHAEDNSSDEQENDRDASLSPNERVHDKKHNRRSSRKVVIRNINYIASGRNEGDGSDSESSSSDVDADSIKEQVEAAVGSLKRQHKSKNKARDESKKAGNKSKNGLDMENGGATSSEEESKGGNWDIFQNLIMRDADSNSKDVDLNTIQVQEELYSTSLDKPKYAGDDFLLTERSTGNGETDVKFGSGEDFRGVVKRMDKDELLMPSRTEGEYYSKKSHFGNESSVIKTQKEEDWILGSKPEASANIDGILDRNIYHGEQTSANHFKVGENKRDVVLDDSFMVQSRLPDGPQQTQPKADIFMVSDIVGANQSENSVPETLQEKIEARNFCEPEDLSMMLGHDSSEQVVTSWTPEMDYGNDISLYETAQNPSKSKQNDSVDATPDKANKIRNSKEPGKKVSVKELKSKAPSGHLVRSKSDIPPRSKIGTAGSTTNRGKTEKEEEKRKRMEELLIQRQKRIAERSAAKGVTGEASKKSSKEIKRNPISTKTENAKSKAPTDENKKTQKPVMRSSTIDRLAAARTTNKRSPTEPKVVQRKKPTSKVNPEMPASSLKKTKGTQEKQDKVSRPGKKPSTNNSKSSSSNIEGRDSVGPTPVVPEEFRSAEGTLRKNVIEDFGDVKVLHTVTSVEKRETTILPTKEAADGMNAIKVFPDKDILSSKDLSMQKEVQSNVDDHVGIAPQISTVDNNLKSTVLKTDEKGSEKKKLSFSPEISVMHISTPPPDSETSPELIPFRKKWNNGESSPKIPKGFRKLLFFGRRS